MAITIIPRLSAAVFSDQPFDFDVQGFRVIIFLDQEGDRHVPRRVGADRARFQSVLSDGDPRPQIHLQHYMIFPEHNGGYPYNYGDAGGVESCPDRRFAPQTRA